MKLLAKEQQESYGKFEIICHYTREYGGAAYSIRILKYSLPKKIPTVFLNGSNYDYHFIMKELAEEFKKRKLLF